MAVDKLTILAPREPVRNSSWVANTINFTIKVADLAKKVVPVEKDRESANLSMFGVNALRKNLGYSETEAISGLNKQNMGRKESM